MSRLLRHPVLLLALAAATPLIAQVTETPETIGPGKVRVEMDGLKLSLDRADAAGNKYEALGVASTVVSVGLTSRLDFQAGVDLFLREEFDLRGARDTRSGLGDVSLRAKWSFLRDEHLGTVALVPYVKLPSSTGGVGTDAVEGGLIVPWASSALSVVNAGAMLQWDVVRNDDRNGYDSRWLLSSYVQRDLVGGFSVYAEGAVQVASTGFSNSTAQLGVGALWQITKRLQLDYELLRGVNSRTVAWTHVIRLDWHW